MSTFFKPRALLPDEPDFPRTRGPGRKGAATVNASKAIAILNASSLVTMMLSMGLRVSVGELLASARPARRLVLGLIANFVLLPAVTLGLLRVFHADPMIAVGFLILASCPAPRSGRRSRPSPVGMSRGPWG